MDLIGNVALNLSATQKMPNLVTNGVRNMWDGIRGILHSKDLPGEFWEEAIGCFGKIQVSNFMRVKNISRKHHIILKQRLTFEGYWQIRFTHKGKRIGKRVHRLYANAFMRNPYNKPNINHKNLIKSDNIPLNLEWSTVLENTLHAKINGAIPVGENVKHSKLTNEQVIGIYSSTKNTKYICDEYGVSKRMVAKIKSGINWASVTKHTKDGLNKYKKTYFN